MMTMMMTTSATAPPMRPPRIGAIVPWSPPENTKDLILNKNLSRGKATHLKRACSDQHLSRTCDVISLAIEQRYKQSRLRRTESNALREVTRCSADTPLKHTNSHHTRIRVCDLCVPTVCATGRSHLVTFTDIRTSGYSDFYGICGNKGILCGCCRQCFYTIRNYGVQ
jgi:hypothetical protein